MLKILNKKLYTNNSFMRKTSKFYSTKSGHYYLKKFILCNATNLLHIDYYIIQYYINKKRIELIYLLDYIFNELDKTLFYEEFNFINSQISNRLYTKVKDYQICNKHNGIEELVDLNKSISEQTVITFIDTCKLLCVCLYGKEYLNTYSTLKSFKYNDSDISYCLEFWKDLHNLINLELDVNTIEPLPEIDF